MSAQTQSRMRTAESRELLSSCTNFRSAKVKFPEVLTPSVGRNRPSLTLSHRTHSRERKCFKARCKEEIKVVPKSFLTNAVDLNYEMVRDIPRLSKNVIESWIEDTLKGGQTLAFPHNSSFDESKRPLHNFGIDREKLLVSRAQA